MLAFVMTFFSLLFGMTNGQMAYLNVLAIPPALSAGAPAVPAPTCDITLSFYDGQSNLIKSSAATISPGASAMLSLSSREVEANGKTRVLVYGQVQLMAGSDSSCQLNGSLELVDPNGRTETLTPLVPQRPALTS